MPFFEFHHSLMPLYSRAETVQQDVEYLASAVSFIGLFAITQFMAVPSRLLVSALHSCFFERFSSSKCNFITSIQVSMQPSDSSLYDFGFLREFLDLSFLSVDFESLVMYVSRDLFRGSKTEAYIVLSCETVVRSGTNLTCGKVGNLVSGVASASGETGFVRPGLDGAALGHSPCLDS